MKRIMLLVTLVLMLAAALALSGVAQAKPISDSPDAKCEKLAIQTLGSSFNPANYTFHGGTAGDDNFSYQGISGPVVFCGFGGNDSVVGGIGAGEIFLVGGGLYLVGTIVPTIAYHVPRNEALARVKPRDASAESQ